MSLRAKIDNIWYHYKSVILIGIFLVGTLIVCLHSCATKPEFDIQIYYVTGESSVYNEQLQWLETAVAAQCGDVNGDGEVTVAVTSLKVGKNTDPSVRAEYLNAVQAGEVLLLFGDPAGIEYLYQNNYLQPLHEFADELDGDGYAWKVSGTPFSQQTAGFELFEDTTLYVSLRVFDETWSSVLPSTKNNYETACNTLRSMITYEAQE